MIGCVWRCLCLCCRNGYLIVATVLTRVVNLIGCMVLELAWHLKLEKSNLSCWCIVANLPCTVIILYIDLVACFPVESTSTIIHRGTGLYLVTCNKGSEVLVILVVCACCTLRYIFIDTRCKYQRKSAESCERKQACLK